MAESRFALDAPFDFDAAWAELSRDVDVTATLAPSPWQASLGKSAWSAALTPSGWSAGTPRT